MKNEALIKTVVFTIIAIGILTSMDMVIFQGGFFVSKLSVIPNRSTVLNEELRASAEEKPKANLTIESLSATPKAGSDFFHKGEKIDFACVLKNTSKTASSRFNSTIETAQKNIVSVKTKSLKADGTVKIEGSFVPENSGVLTVLCRSDANKQIAFPLNIYIQ
jgi:hypothetical protein